MTQTINELFGSKVTVPGTGLILNNTMAMFDPHPGTANAIAPGKRMLSSMRRRWCCRMASRSWRSALPAACASSRPCCRRS